MKLLTLALILSLLGAPCAFAQNNRGFVFNSEDHVALIGGTLADRFQHSGWLETYLYEENPDKNLVFRDLAVPGDEVVQRLRPEGFGSPDDWLTKVNATVILAFFGFNESFQGPTGLTQFTHDLDHFLKETKGREYAAHGAPRVVLFSPIAPEYGEALRNYGNLKLYTTAMQAVARSNQVPFVDLFRISQKIFHSTPGKKTINGIHLNDAGDQLLAAAIVKELSTSGVPGHKEDTAKLRAAILDKDYQWEERYRTIDGNNVYGGRSVLAYAPGKQMIYDKMAAAPYLSNFKVMQEEMAQRDTMTANRDHRIWALLHGRDLPLANLDTNLPPVTPVPTDLPGSNPDESHTFLGGEEAISRMTVHSHMKVNLFASEEQFPALVNPVQMAWDPKGRLWVAAWKNYPERTPDSKIGDSLLILEDTKHTGHADKLTVFMTDLNAPTGFQFYQNGVFVMEAPDLWFVQNQNDHTGPIERVLMGISSADSHHTANSLCYEPGGAIYLSDGIFHRSQVETAEGPLRNYDGAIYRYEPRTQKFETYASYNFMNPHGRVFDYWGNDLITDATGNNTYFGPALSGHIDFPAKHSTMNQFWDRPSRPCAGTGLLSSRQFPADLQGDFMDCNVIGFQGIYLVKVVPDGSGLKGERQEDLVSSTDPNFRPCAANIGPDGAIYFADWHKPIIGHMQHHLRDPNRDHDHGRIYRIVYEDRPLVTQPKIDGQSIPALLDLLKEPENRTRELAKIELGKHRSAEVIPALDKWVRALAKSDPDYEHHLLEALWVHQWNNIVDTELLKRVLRSPRWEARAAAGRVLGYWRDRVPDSLALFQALADDDQPGVRLQAVRGASFYRNAEATEVALAAVNHPLDYYLDYTLGETLRQLKPWWQEALLRGEPVAVNNSNGLKRLLEMLDLPELQKLPRTQMVLQAIVGRADATETDRLNALGQLANTNGNSHVAELFELFSGKVDHDPKAAASFARLLVWQRPDELKAHRDQLAALARHNPTPELREAAWICAARADGNYEKVWADASRSENALVDLLNGIPLLNDQEFRARAFSRVQALLEVKVEEPKAVRRAAVHAIASMGYEPKTVFTLLTTLIDQKEAVAAAAEGLRILPRAAWPKEQAAAAALGLAAWAETVPNADRTSQDYIETVQLASDLGGFLPEEKGAAFQNELNALRVPVFIIRTVREQMRYDTPRVVVSPQQAIEIRFENADFMPHNLVIVKPGTREKVGLATGRMKPEQLDQEGRAYIADREDILQATRLIEPGQRAVLKFTTPAAAGDYEYLCTFPGHYQIMRGLLVVTPNVGDYLRSHPQVVLTAPKSNLE